MSILLKMIDEANVPLSLFCEKLSITEERALEIAHSVDDEAQMDVYWEFVTVLNDESLFPELLDFYKPFVEDKEELSAFIASVLRLRGNNVPRRMLNSVHRLITLADAMEDIRPGKDSLKVFHFVVCIETLFHLRDGHVPNKAPVVVDFFDNYLDTGDKQVILARFRRSLGDERYALRRLNHESEPDYLNRMQSPNRMNTQITIEAFARIINEIRNCFAHEGDYWNFNFAKSDVRMMNSLTVGETRAEVAQKRNGVAQGLQRVYEVDLTYEQFKGACIRAFLQVIRTYLNEIKG